MPLPDALSPVSMRRVAIVAIESRLRDTLALVADSGSMELDGELGPLAGPEVDALRRLERGGATRAEPAVTPTRCDLAELERRAAWPLLAGEADLSRRAASAVRHGPVAGLVGWMPENCVEPLRERLRHIGSAVVELPQPRWSEPPTLLRAGRIARPFRPLVDTYGPARYRDVDPTAFTAVTFVLMFGMMFGDVGHGLVLVALALLLRQAPPRRVVAWRPLWPLLALSGLSAAAFGLLYGEAFGPTGLVPTLWLSPLDDPIRLLVVGIGFGAILLAISYAIGTVNRMREAGLAEAVTSPSGLSGFLLFLAAGCALLGWQVGATPVLVAGAVLGLVALVLLGIGFLGHSGGGGVGAAETAVELLDTVLRTGGNTVSFARLAAFGLMHAAIGAAVLDGVAALRGGALGWAAAIALFVVGNIVAFSLEALVAGVQALRLEYYELFSRIFAGEGRAFAPWHIPSVDLNPKDLP